MVAPCPVAFLLGWEGDPCKGLRWEEAEGRFYCRAVEQEPARTRKQLEENMAIGAGCSSSLCNTQREACKRGLLAAYLETLASKR